MLKFLHKDHAQGVGKIDVRHIQYEAVVEFYSRSLIGRKALNISFRYIFIILYIIYIILLYYILYIGVLHQ